LVETLYNLLPSSLSQLTGRAVAELTKNMNISIHWFVDCDVPGELFGSFVCLQEIAELYHFQAPQEEPVLLVLRLVYATVSEKSRMMCNVS
jgi:hypothetical protein